MSLALPEINRLELPPIKADQTARAFRHLRWCLTRNTVRSLLSGSRLRLSMILFCSVVFWVGLFGLFLGGFEFIGLSDELFHAIFEYLFSMFFLSISIMLFFSTGIITYTALFHSREGAFLLSTPATTDRIFAYKFAEAVAISSWGFFLLGSPLMAAYGITVEAPAAFYAMFLIYLVMFVLIAGSLGAITAIVVANIFPRRQKFVLAVGRDRHPGPDRRPGDPALADARRHPRRATGSATCKTGWRFASIRSGPAAGCPPACSPRLGATGRARATTSWFSRHTRRSGTWPRPPSRATSISAVTAASRGAGATAAASGFMSSTISFTGCSFSCPGRFACLILKDLRTFRRDPAQWSQFLIFFGLLAFYFLNIPRLGYGVQSPSWRNLVSFLNISVTALILSTFTSRFIFPLLSLEGRNFWVLGLLPVAPGADPLG